MSSVISKINFLTVNTSQAMSAQADSMHYIAYLHTMHTLHYIYGDIQSRHYSTPHEKNLVVLETDWLETL